MSTQSQTSTARRAIARQALAALVAEQRKPRPSFLERIMRLETPRR